MTTIITNAAAVGRAYERRRAQWDNGLRAGLRRIAVTVERKQVENLGGPGTAPAGAYPVPIRTGHLRRSSGFRVESRAALVFNTAIYARAIHEGFTPFGNRKAKRIRARQFLADAAKAVDASAIMQAELRRVLR